MLRLDGADRVKQTLDVMVLNSDPVLHLLHRYKKGIRIAVSLFFIDLLL
jgi:hypothetical protein